MLITLVCSLFILTTADNTDSPTALGHCTPPVIEHGRVSPNEFIRAGELYTVFCRCGYALSGNKRIECHGGEVLSDIPSCADPDTECSKPTITNGVVSPADAIILYLETYTVVCDEGFVASGDGPMSCQPTSQLDVIHTCEAPVSTCDKPAITNGTVSPDTANVTYQNSYTVVCDEGYTVSGEGPMTCQTNEALDITHSCIVNTCDKPTIANGVVSPPYDTIDYASSYTLTCNDKYLASSTADMNCLADGTLDLVHDCVSEFVTITPSSPYLVSDGRPVLTCTYTGQDNTSSVQWFRGNDYTNSDNEILNSNPNFNITTGEFDYTTYTRSSEMAFNSGLVYQSGNYTCLWAADPLLHDTALVVLRYLKMVPSNETTYSLDGNVSLTCVYEGLKTTNITWMYLGNHFEDNNYQRHELTHNTDDEHHKIYIEKGEYALLKQTFTLVITNANPEVQAGDYDCIMDFGDETEPLIAETEVVIRKTTIFHSPLVEYILETGPDLSLICLFEGDEVPTDVTWYDGDGNVIEFDGITNIENENTQQLSHSYKSFSNITLKNFTVADEGVYTCAFYLAPNTISDSVEVVKATVQADECVFIDFKEEATKELSCTYNGTQPALNATFISHSLVTQSPVVHAAELGVWSGGLQTATHLLTNISTNTSGSYTCVFKLTGGHRVSTVIRVDAREALIETNTETLSPAIVTGATLTLSCSVVGGAISVNWFKDGSKDFEYTTTNPCLFCGEDFSDYESEIYFDVTEDYAGLYWCEAVYYNEYCTTPHTLTSRVVRVTIISAVPNSQPSSLAVYEGAANASLVCVFPNPFPSETPEINWLFDDNVLLSSGDYYEDQEIVIDGDLQTEHDFEITTTLTINNIDEEVEGDYVCTIKWGTFFITSDPATLSVRSITADPENTNVVDGNAVELTCVARGNTSASIEFYSSGGSAVSTVTQEDDSATGAEVVTTTGVLTIATASSSDATEYYCRAQWDTGYVDSASVYLSVIGMEATSTVVWGVVEQVATFRCMSAGLLRRNSDGDVYLDTDGNEVYPEVEVEWEFWDIDTSSFVGATEDRFTVSSSTIGTDGTRISPLVLSSLISEDEGLLVRCVISYTSDSANNFYGGTVTSGSMTLKIASIISLNASESDIIAGDTVTFTCVAQGEVEPDFYFTTDGAQFDTAQYTHVSGPTTTTSGYEYTAEYVTTANRSNVLQGGDTVYCEADFGATIGSSDKSVDIMTYYNCENVAVTVIGEDPGVSISYEDDVEAGTRTATVACPADTDEVRYTFQESTDTSASATTCSKTTGLYDPQYLSTCLETIRLDSGYYEMYYDLSAYNQGDSVFTICDESTSSSPYDYDSLHTMMETESDVCGPYSIAPCLLASTRTCTLGSDTGCRFDTSTSIVYFFYTVELTTPVWTLEERNDLVLPASGSMRVFSCSSKRRRREEAASADFFENLQNTTVVEHHKGPATSKRSSQQKGFTAPSDVEATGSKVAVFVVSLVLLAIAIGYITFSYVYKRNKTMVTL